MRSSVQMLFQVDKSTAVGIQPIKAMRKAKPAPSKGLKSAGRRDISQRSVAGRAPKGHDGAYQ